jgi:hypothetical protein
MKIRYKKIKDLPKSNKKIADGNLRIFRLAVATTVEFSKMQHDEAGECNTAKRRLYCCIGTNVCYD